MSDFSESWGPPPPAAAPPEPVAWTRVALAVAATCVALAAGFLLKRTCRYDGDQYKRDCYTDVVPLYGARDPEFQVDHGYKPFALHGLAYKDNKLEYPALTGLFISGVNAPVRTGDSAGFLRMNAAGLSVFALAAAVALAFLAARGERLVLFALAPALVAYAFHNWDLIAVGFTCLGLWAFARGRDGIAGSMLGLGAAAKLFPAFLVPVLWAARRHESRSARPLLAGSIFWFAIPNAIVLAYAGFGGWWFPWKFQSSRAPNFETWGYFLGKHLSGHQLGSEAFWFGQSFGKAAQAGATLVFLATAGLLLRREWSRDRFRPVTASMGVLTLFLITTKVFSPQYALWLLPFFVLVSVPWWGYVAFALADLFVLGSIWAFLLANARGGTAEATILEIAVWLRYAVLALVLWLSRRAEDLVRPVR